MKSSAIMDAIRGIFATFDRGIYNLISTTYELITTIANAQIVNDTFISDMTNKFYSFIAVFMVFKICFSLINYLINPDSILDKQKGGAKLITNIIITFALIIITPMGFDLLREAQSAILDEGIIEKIVSGEGYKDFQISEVCGDRKVVPGTTQGDPDPEKNYKAGQYFALVTIRPFIQVNTHQDAPINELVSDTDYCKSGYISDVLSYDVITFDNSNFKAQYAIDYNYFISTLVGGAILLILLSFTFDVALRSVKLIFLEIIAPIPVMSFIDPNSGKKGLFGKWIKEVGVTWADLFLRLFAVTFSTTLISGFEFSGENGFWVNLIMLAGLLLFAKKLPDILKKMFNIDLKGDFSLNPLKKLKDAADFAKPVTGLAGGAIGLAAGAANFGRGNNWKQKLVNGFSGMKKGMVSGYKNPYSITKGGLSSLSPYVDKTKKSWNEIDEARGKLKEFNKFEIKGKGYVDKALNKAKAKGLLSEDGTKYNIDEFKADNFKNEEYKESFKEVQTAKKNFKNAKDQLIAAQNNMEYLNAEHAPLDVRNAALKKVQEASNKVDKLTGILDGKKARHKIVQQQNPDDTKIENAMEEYLSRNPDALNVASVNVDHIETPQSTTSNQNTNMNQNNNSYEKQQQFKDYDEIIKDRTSKQYKLKQELEKLNNSYGGSTDKEKEEIQEQLNEYQREIDEASEGRLKLEEEQKLSHMEQSHQNAENDLKDGVEQVHNDAEINYPTTVNNMSYDEYKASMKGETTFVDKAKNVVSGAGRIAFDAMTHEKNNDSTANHITSHINEETNSYFNEKGEFTMSGNDMYEEALRRDQEAREKRKQEEEKNNKKNNFFHW